MPPFKSATSSILLSEEALSGTYMGGYEGITYDLGRYVLIDHITSALPDNGEKSKKQYDALIESIAKDQPEFAGISSQQLILSAAYAFITGHGWNKEFRYHGIDGRRIQGVDSAISGSHWSATHGSQSPVMTICEKYVWQARKYIGGFLADHIMYVADDDDANYVSDYGVLDNFLIPAMEIDQVNPEMINALYPWHIPEMDSVIISGNPNSANDVIYAVQNAPDISWKEWIQIDNSKRQYPIDRDNLIALNGFSCFEGSGGVETNLYICSILVSQRDFDCFIEKIIKDPDVLKRVSNPPDWIGGIYANCYITPKEICWMPWKKRYNSINAAYFSGYKIQSAVDECTDNFIEYGDASYKLPSTPIREMIKIADTDGYMFYDCDNQIKAASISVGEKWRTQQNNLLVDRSVLKNVVQSSYMLLWIMREERRETIKAKERFGDFYTEKDCSYIGFFQDEEFNVIHIPTRVTQKVGKEETNNLLSDILDKCGYGDEIYELTEQIESQ